MDPHWFCPAGSGSGRTKKTHTKKWRNFLFSFEMITTHPYRCEKFIRATEISDSLFPDLHLAHSLHWSHPHPTPPPPPFLPCPPERPRDSERSIDYVVFVHLIFYGMVSLLRDAYYGVLHVNRFKFKIWRFGLSYPLPNPSFPFTCFPSSFSDTQEETRVAVKNQKNPLIYIRILNKKFIQKTGCRKVWKSTLKRTFEMPILEFT